MNNSHRFCVAPMLDHTDRHFRYLARLLTRHSMLYTEMITTSALIHGNREHLLKHNPNEYPVALQLGGSNPSDMARCAHYAAEYNYDEININVGCPSNKVQVGKFGACLMLKPEIVAECIKAMVSETEIEITVKTRIGVDNYDSYENLFKFVDIIAAAGCETVIIHARKAYLSGLTPKENRTVPPLRYEYAYRLKQDFPQLNIILNGGIRNKNEIYNHLGQLDGVMVGREAYGNLYFLADVDKLIFNDSSSVITRPEVLKKYKLYMQLQLANDVLFKIMARPVLGLFNGLPGAKAWRRHISEHAYKKDAGLEILDHAESLVTNMYGAALAN